MSEVVGELGHRAAPCDEAEERAVVESKESWACALLYMRNGLQYRRLASGWHSGVRSFAWNFLQTVTLVLDRTFSWLNNLLYV